MARSSTLAAAMSLALTLAAGPAAALGLGQIQVKSQPGQPLVAEIPIISSDPSELQGLQVQLASPETFRRVGLEPPQGAASSLHFEPALDAAGRPVIRVTSAVPIQTPLLTFLLEVDWGQGRLVREYSALIDAPRTVAAPIQPPIQAPAMAPSNTIDRPPAPAVAATPAVKNTPPPNPPSRPAPPTPVNAPVDASTPADHYGPVKAGQTLGQIAADLEGTQGYSVAQTMLALLRANPEAFIGGNINRLKRGAVLRLPPPDELARIDQRQAAALVHEQVTQWREARRTVPQPAAVAAAPATPKAANATGNTVAKTAPARTSGARLEIVPPSAGRGQQASTRSGVEAGGEGDMLRQQLQETKETLAARDAEVNELKTRLAELEKLQQQQQQLITMKDSALAAAQQKLAETNRKAATPVVGPAVVQQQPATQPQAPQSAGGTPWLLGGGALLLTALVGWLLTRRRQSKVVVPTAKRGFDTRALAATMVPPTITGTADSAAADEAADERIVSSDQSRSEPVGPMPAEPVVPPWHAGTPALEPMEAASDAGQQLELAQAYLDLGDDDAARALLRDVLNGRDPAARDRAARLLRDL
jgi:pilus assembly protein FimV